MPTDHRESLARIRSFPQLVAYLRDELGWPIESDDFEELTFEYDPQEELGIDAKNAAKIQQIKRLRPLVPGQPWGIFFVKFEPKRLPVVALRRILGQVGLKKRASANKSERQAWAADDLLFVSNYGEGDERRMAFAHFSNPQDGHDLPTLKVLGWDNLDTPLHFDAVARELTDHLTWPDDERDPDAWRERWRAAFKLRHREVVTTSRDLSERLAELARAIRDRTRTALAIETETGPLTKLMKAFQTALVHDLDEAGFADMYAQTIAYGLLSARITDPERRSADDLAAHMRTNPFLKELLETFLHVGGRRGKAGGPEIDFDELGVSEVVELLDEANMDAVVRDFGDRNPQEDPVIHFYEHFLAAYDKKQKVSRGVFYTPRPVVSYIVRSVDELLRTELGLADGLADTTTWAEIAMRHKSLKIPEGTPPTQAFVQILDPATGTGTFVVEVIDLIHNTMAAKWKSQGHRDKQIQALWNDYVPKHLLPRLHGYELLMAPYAIAHLKIGLKLYETGYRFGSKERARIYLTNALAPKSDSGQLRLTGVLPALAHEAEAVNEIKFKQRFTVLIGNPPYSDASQNLGPQFEGLIKSFRFYEGARIRERGAIRFEHVINNDYAKFWGLCIGLVSKVPAGVIGLITSNSYLGGKSFRGVRDSMRRSSQLLRITNLHGAGWSGELARAGIEDENVFAIQTGVAVCLMAKFFDESTRTTEYGELVGSYGSKTQRLTASPSQIDLVAVQDDPRSYYSFIPPTGNRCLEYYDYPQLDELFHLSVDGIKTSRDGLVTGNTREECISKIRSFTLDDEAQSAIEERFKFKCNRLDFSKARRLVANRFNEARVHQIAYRPFDLRFIYYDEALILSHRMNTMPKILCAGAEAIVCASRLSGRGFDHALSARTLCANKYASHDINSRMFLVTFCEDSESGKVLRGGVRPRFLTDAGVPANLPEVERSRMFGAYLLAVLNAPSYRSRYFEDIQQDFPRVPLPATVSVLRELAVIGGKMADAQCLAKDLPANRFAFVGAPAELCTAPRLKGDKLWIGQNSFIEDVSEDVWEYTTAGFQVCKSWFTAGGRSGLARRGEPLSPALVDGIRQVLSCVRETISLRAEADGVIEGHGGWPRAFSAGTK